MERTKQKSKKEKPNKYLEKEKSSSFISDVKAFKENLKIREILKTVKMNSSMRIKAPRGSKVMQNKDFNDNEDMFDDVVVSGSRQVDEPPSATNFVLNNENESEILHEKSIEEEKKLPTLIENQTDNASSIFQKSKSLSEGIDECGKGDNTSNTPEFPLPLAESAGAKSRNRKLSLDHTMLLRREGLSQSEVDLNYIGKSPLERKSSFFRKKMDSFVRNTTEIFKRQSMSSKSASSPVTSRRDSTSSRMSVSLQSLNEDSAFFEEFKNIPLNTYRDQEGSVSSLATPRTDSTLSVNVNDRLLEQAEVAMASSPLPEDQLADTPATSIYRLNKEPIQDSLLNTRAISMSSGLDTATGQRRRKTSRSNRVSWLASESLTDYFRSLIQDEKSKEIQGWQSYQDFSAIPENRVDSKMDSKGRRLSYMRAVSGEDPSLASSFRKKKLMETEVPFRPPTDLERVLARFTQRGIPLIVSYVPHFLPEEAQSFLQAASSEKGLASLFPKRGGTTPFVDTQQAILQELVVTEAQYVHHLKVVVDVYLATAHALQDKGFLLEINTWMVFSHLPDIYNSAIIFWEVVIYPMLRQAKYDGSLLDPKLIVPGLLDFPKLFQVYEEFLQEQITSMEYLRNLSTETDFSCYLKWCNQHTDDRLQLRDILIKPLQRLTKYSLIISRLRDYVMDKETKKDLELVVQKAKTFVARVNQAVRQKEELVRIDEMRIDPFEPDYRGDEEADKLCRKYSIINLHLPMIDCGKVGRCLIHQGMARYKDSMKEFDAHVLLFTDMMLICKKLPKIKERDREKPKKEYTHWRMLRPKIMLTRLLKVHTKNTDALSYVILDEMGSSSSVFHLSLSTKDSFGENTAKVWEMKICEAMITYALTKLYVQHPPIELDDVLRVNSIAENYQSGRPRQRDLEAVEKQARIRVAAMFYKKKEDEEDKLKKKYQQFKFELRLMGEYAKYYPHKYNYRSFKTINQDLSMYIARNKNTKRKGSWVETKVMFSEGAVSSQPTVEDPAANTQLRTSMAQGTKKNPKDKGARGRRRQLNIYEIFEDGIAQKIKVPPRPLTQNVVMSSCESHEELRTDPVHRSGSALEQTRPPFFFEEESYRSPVMKFLMNPDNNTQTLVLSQSSVRTPAVVLQESSPNHSPGPRSASAGASSENTLRVASTVTLVHSMPDINSEICRVLSVNLEPRPIQLSASERLYRSHQELMHRNRLAAGQHYLKPDHRGSSYPPPSPRALQRGDAVSFSFRYPPLTRANNVPERASTSQLESNRREQGLPVHPRE